MNSSDDVIYNQNPATGNTVSEHKIAGEGEIRKAFEKASLAQSEWQKISVGDRVDFLEELEDIIVEKMDKIIETIKIETGKVEQEALTSDILPTLRMIRYYKKNAAKILEREKRSTPLLAFESHAYVDYFPRGTVAIISPWNYPFQLAAVPVITAITAGNAAILKPSELTPQTGKLISDLFLKLNMVPENLLQVLQGPGRVGAEMIDNNPDMIFFTGSNATGKKIMKQAAERLIPLELELGGKDPLIVLKDADLERASEGAAYGAFTNTGQLCVSVERAYVHESAVERFIRLVKKRGEKISWESHSSSPDYGPFIHPGQKEKVVNLIHDAIEQGAELIGELPGEGRENNFFPPLILKNVDHSMKIMEEEIFGPVLPVMSFTNEEEALEYASDSRFGLNASIWSQDTGRAERLAEQLETGNCMINDVIRNVGNPSLPFGGVKESGMGRYHGPEGLKKFSNTRSIMTNRSKSKRELNWFPFSEDLVKKLKDFVATFYGKKSFLFANYFSKIPSILSLLWLFIKNKFLRGEK